MVRARFKPVTPDQPIRDLRKDRKAIDKDEPSAQRAVRLAAFVRAAHDLRELNMAMHAAQECLAEDPDAPALLVAAYDETPDGDVEAHLRRLVDLEDLARYVGREDVGETATARVREVAKDWITDAGPAERVRLRTLNSIFDRAFVDTLRDEIRFG